MNELQKVEFELLKVFIEICDKLNLKYFLVCGSALGAVKYNGFIPWDDDVDVALYREDYKIFQEKAGVYLPEGIVFQTYLTDREYPNIYGKLRNSNTTYIEKSSEKLNINHGIYIDVFPLDGYPKTKWKQDWLEFQKRICRLRQMSTFGLSYSKKQSILNKIFHMCGIHKRSYQTAKMYERIISKYPVHDSDLICNHGNWQGKLEYAPFQQYGKGVIMKFEGFDVCVPERYDEYLTQKYGDWRAELPPEKQVGHHFYEIMDIQNPYTKYIQSVSKDGKTIQLKK